MKGAILVMDTLGNMVGRYLVKEYVEITDLAWNCERFSMEEQAEAESVLPSGRPNGEYQIRWSLNWLSGM